MHPGSSPQLILLGVTLLFFFGEFYMPAAHITIVIEGVGKDGQRAQGNAITRLNDVQIIVAQGSWPVRWPLGCEPEAAPIHRNVVVAPLYVHTVVVHQFIHDNVCAGAAVKDISHQMEAVHGKTA